MKTRNWKIGAYLYDDQEPNLQEIVDDCGVSQAIACDVETAEQICREHNNYESLLESCKLSVMAMMSGKCIPQTLKDVQKAIAQAEI